MSAPMSFKEFGDLLRHIASNNSPMKSNDSRPSVKYVDPVMDMRFNNVFAVTLRGFGFEDKVFHTQNECRDLEQSLEERIREFLDTPLHSQ